MKNLKTFEGFFDFFKKKKKYDSISIEHVMDFLLPIIDCDYIKSDLKRDTIDGIFGNGCYTDYVNIIGNESYYSDKIHIEDGCFHMIKTWDQYRNTPKDTTNIIFFHLQYSPVKVYNPLHNIEVEPVSDDKVDEIIKEIQYNMDGICKVTFFIGYGVREGWASDKEFSDIKTMIEKTVNKSQTTVEIIERSIRNITVKIEAPGGIEL